MTTIKGHQLLELHPDTIESVRKMYDLDDPKRMEEAIDILEKWMAKQNHFLEKKCPKKYLESSIISNKGSIEKTKSKLDKLFAFRTIFPHLYNYSNIRNDFKDLLQCCNIVPLPKLTKDHYRVILGTLDSNEFFFKTSFTAYFNLYSIFFEYLRMNDYSNGCIFVLDHRRVNMLEVISKLNPVEVKQFSTLLLDGYGLRVKGIYSVTTSKAVETLFSIFRPALGQKVGQRLYVRKDLESLYEVLPKDIFPVEYGGTERSLKELQEDWIDLLSSDECTEFLNWTKKARVDESYRLNDKYDEYTGLPGTFRNINVD